jgi:hypothetical protein
MHFECDFYAEISDNSLRRVQSRSGLGIKMPAVEFFAAEKKLVVIISDERFATAVRALAYAWDDDESGDAATRLLARVITECHEAELPLAASAA